jgi:hypothetical protein
MQYQNITGAPIDLGNGVSVPPGAIVELSQAQAAHFGGRLKPLVENKQLLIEAPIGYAEAVIEEAESVNESVVY